MLYACGSNGNGQLGLGCNSDVDNWTEVEIELSGSIRVVGGGNHTVILELSSGKCWVTKDAKFQPLNQPDHKKWRHVGAGWSFTALVDELDQLWFIEHESNGGLGLSSASHAEPIARLNLPLLPGETVASLASGMRHSVILTSSGRVFAWGASRKGQCGFKTPTINAPTLLALNDFDTVASIACGRDFTTLITKDYRILVFGDNKKFDTRETLASSSSAIVGWSNFVIGNTIYGPTDHSGIKVPTHPPLTEISEPCKAMGSEHLIWASGDTVYTSGWGEHGNCPSPSHFDTVLAVFGGCATSFVYTA